MTRQEKPAGGSGGLTEEARSAIRSEPIIPQGSEDVNASAEGTACNLLH